LHDAKAQRRNEPPRLTRKLATSNRTGSCEAEASADKSGDSNDGRASEETTLPAHEQRILHSDQTANGRDVVSARALCPRLRQHAGMTPELASCKI
jgi:hypothetical protein